MLPPFSDNAAWRTLASRTGWWRDIEGEALCKAFRQVRANPARVSISVAEYIARGLFAKLTKDVRSGVRRSLPNEGIDIVDATVNLLYERLMDLGSSDGLALCLSYRTVVNRRRMDQVRATLRREARFKDLSTNPAALETTVVEPSQRAPLEMDIEAILAAVPDERKRDAFRLRHLDGVAVELIAQRYDVSVRTVNRWEHQSRAVLAAEVMRVQGE